VQAENDYAFVAHQNSLPISLKKKNTSLKLRMPLNKKMIGVFALKLVFTRNLSWMRLRL